MKEKERDGKIKKEVEQKRRERGEKKRKRDIDKYTIQKWERERKN